MAQLFTPRFQAEDANGLPYSGALLYFYQAGTSTLDTVYQDADATTPHANPVVADAAGTFAAIFLPTGDYKFILKTAAGVTLQTVDDYNVPSWDPLYVSPEDYGAIGDGNGAGGGTNDATALQAAITAASAAKVQLRLKRKIYRCDSTLTAPAGTEIVGYGAEIDFSAGGNLTGIDFASGGMIAGVTLNGAGNAAYNAAGIAIACTGTNNSPSAPTFVDAPIIRDCIIQEWSAYGVFFSYVNGGKVTGCQMTGIGYAGVGGVSCNDTIVADNLVNEVSPGTSGDAYGIFIDRQNGTSETADPRSYRCGILNNVIKNVAAGGGNNGQGIDTHGGVDFRIIGNSIDTCEAGIFVTASSISGTQQLGPKRCTVQGNTITGARVGYGIMVSGAISGSSVNDYAEGIVVSGNTILGHGIGADGTSGCINLQGTKGCAVTGNTIKAPACHGIYLNFGNIAFNVADNVIVDPFDSTYTTPSCIGVRGNDNRGYIGGNTFRFEDAGLGTNVAVNSIAISASLTGLEIEIGKCAFVGIAASRLSYSEGTATGINAAGLMMQRGRAQVALTDAASNSVVVSFNRFPVASPRVSLQRNGTPVPGTVAKSPQLESSGVSATQFTIVARPYDLTTFGGSGTIEVDWVATN